MPMFTKTCVNRSVTTPAARSRPRRSRASPAILIPVNRITPYNVSTVTLPRNPPALKPPAFGLLASTFGVIRNCAGGTRRPPPIAAASMTRKQFDSVSMMRSIGAGEVRFMAWSAIMAFACSRWARACCASWRRKASASAATSGSVRRGIASRVAATM